MNTMRAWAFIGIVLLFICVLAACAQAVPTEAPAAEAPAEPTRVAAATEAPAVAQPTQAPPPTKLPQPTLIPSETPGYQPATPKPSIEQRLVELEWPERMRLGDSDVIRLTLIPSAEGYVVQTEFEQHRTVTETIKVPRPGGYDLFAAARLDGVGFTISPPGEEELYVPPDEPVTWRWSLTPHNSGQQRLSVVLKFRWKLADQPSTIVRETVAYSRGLDVRVSSFLGLSLSQAMRTGWMGFIVGGCLLLAAIMVRPRLAHSGRIHTTFISPPSNPNLTIELHPGLTILPIERALLQTLFHRYDRLIVEREFLSGYSGARTFLALPVRSDGRADAYTIAKISEKGAIQHEYDNYETYVKDTLPPITARIQHPPVTLHSSTKHKLRMEGQIPSIDIAALQYTFIGEPGATPTSLGNMLQTNSESQLINKLFTTFGPNWWMQKQPYVFRAALEYDRLLPTHLVIQPFEGHGKDLDGRTPPNEIHLETGEYVTLRHFHIIERRLDGRSLSLVGDPATGQPPLRVRWMSLSPPNGVRGRIIATRQSLLDDIVQNMTLYQLPDPFIKLPDLMGQTLNGTKSIIHGDLNLENILVGPGGLVWLIDFANTREGHTLFDFAHLEAEIIAHILASRFNSPEEYLDWMINTRVFQGISNIDLATNPSNDSGVRLLNSIHEIARQCLFNPSYPREFQLSLAFTCLGALKFTNLTPIARHLLYLTAAHLTENL